MKKNIFLIFLVLTMTIGVSAQPGYNPCGPDQDEEEECTEYEIPLDSNVGILIGVGIVLGYRLRKVMRPSV